MNAAPSIEAILLQVHQSLELPPYTTKQKASFAQLKRPLNKHYEQLNEILDGIYRALEIHNDESACADLSTHIVNFALFQKALELKTWTFNADAKQVIWQLISHSYVPGIARVMAFWHLDDVTDKGMPGGRFWYLPTETEDRLRVMMPVEQVCAWLLDLIGIPLDRIRETRLNNNDPDNLIRNIYNWKSGKVPRYDTIKNSFPDKSDIEFKGCLYVDSSAAVEIQLETVAKFIQFKNLSSEDLIHEIPIRNSSEIDKIIAGNGKLENIKNFIKLMSIRYAQPTFKTIRQRLHIAKAIQDGYKRLIKYLCPCVSPKNMDLAQNKVLQLCHIYKYIYNLTIEAHRLNHGELAENEWFDGKLPLIDKHSLFLSVAPSMFTCSSSLLGEILTKRFNGMKSSDPLMDLFDENKDTTIDLFKYKVDEQARWASETIAIDVLQKNVTKGSPWRSFQKEDRYWVLTQVIQSLAHNPKAFNAGLNRLKEVATSLFEEAGIIQLELNYLVDMDTSKRPKNIQETVEYLLAEIEKNEGYQIWQAPALAAKAKHCIALNEFKSASRFFKEALDACSERSYGPLRGFIARDTLATLLQIEKLNKNNHERYLREMMANDVFEIKNPFIEVRLESVARDLNTYFWDELYKPYHRIAKLKPATDSPFLRKNH
ncbi:hypothetical protein [Paraglaciecola sp. MB-3u-78]|uniref:hypothetical protein n=1 Tax=Paraglaciecola sp. MB-3u-78 TaxID=2058332 RepID=UPI000C32F10E|nr:hypothetical protein [Paraglaciecola sp. MB-3u-78]PKG93144.1 hypothetical protein CXF95_26515 [Paraglaciecola sp. MB-3u-78]